MMKIRFGLEKIIFVGALLVPSLALGPSPSPASGAVEVCVLKTDFGTMVFEFFEADAPRTTAQFKTLVRKGFYDGQDFYRVVRGHVIQTGGGSRV